jgi:uncharacterized protein (TIGR02145 family)
MKKLSCLLLVSIVLSFASYAQNIGIGTQTPDSSALLELSSNSKGFLPPRMTTIERNAINNPAVGLMIYNTTTDCVEIFSKGRWQQMFCGTVDSSLLVDTTAVTDIDGNTYPTVKICNQTWMAKNLDVARYRNGDIIPQVRNRSEWANLTTGAWCWYNNDSANGAIYGRLYNWYAVNDPRGLAPQGWHVPSDAEWNVLIKCLDVDADTICLNCWQNTNAGGALKSTTGWNTPNIGATNNSGFSALPGGFRDSNGDYYYLNSCGLWWLSSWGNLSGAWMRNLCNDVEGLFRGDYHFKSIGFSIRCVKDVPPSTIDSGLVAYYPFNGNANDESGNGNNGVVNGPTLTTDRFGNSNKAYDFNGVNNYILMSNSNTLNPSIITINLWMNCNDSNRCLIEKSDQSNATNLGYSINYKDEFQGWKGLKTSFGKGQCSTVSNPVIYSPQNMFDGPQWKMITVIIQSNGNVSQYLNGVLVYQEQTNQSFIPCNDINSTLRIGGPHWDNDPEWYIGKIDDIRIYNRALTQEEISYLAGH